MSHIYIGTYTRNGSQGIYVCRFDKASGQLGKPRLAAQLANPSFLASTSDGKRLYAVSEIPDGRLSAFTINSESGELALLNHASTGGSGPCHLSVDAVGKNVLVANYGSGNVTVIPTDENGFLKSPSAIIQHVGSSVHPQRQQKPHVHSVTLSPANRFALVADLGLDRVFSHRFGSAQGSLALNQPPSAKINAGAGPRHCAFHPNGQWLYVINELESTVTFFVFDPAGGSMAELQTASMLPEHFQGENASAEIKVHPSGRFLYGSNRGHDSISLFAIDFKTGAIKLLSHVFTQGKTPRHFGIDPTGTFLVAANQDSDSIVVFRINRESGVLIPIGQMFGVKSPSCVQFIPI